MNDEENPVTPETAARIAALNSETMKRWNVYGSAPRCASILAPDARRAARIFERRFDAKVERIADAFVDDTDAASGLPVLSADSYTYIGEDWLAVVNHVSPDPEPLGEDEDALEWSTEPGLEMVYCPKTEKLVALTPASLRRVLFAALCFISESEQRTQTTPTRAGRYYHFPSLEELLGASRDSEVFSESVDEIVEAGEVEEAREALRNYPRDLAPYDDEAGHEEPARHADPGA